MTWKYCLPPRRGLLLKKRICSDSKFFFRVYLLIRDPLKGIYLPFSQKLFPQKILVQPVMKGGGGIGVYPYLFIRYMQTVHY